MFLKPPFAVLFFFSFILLLSCVSLFLIELVKRFIKLLNGFRLAGRSAIWVSARRNSTCECNLRRLPAIAKRMPRYGVERVHTLRPRSDLCRCHPV